MSPLMTAVPHVPDVRARMSVRRWKVVHAAEEVVGVLALAAAQADAGMYPTLLTSDGWLRPGAELELAPSPSLLRELRQARRWRNLLRGQDLRAAADVLHAHCLPAAMAARSSLPFVYDVMSPIQNAAVARQSGGACALRSLNLAETLVMRKAPAVVVHSRPLWSWALRRGVQADDLYLVPEPVALPEAGMCQSPRPESNVSFFIPDLEDAASLELLLRAFAMMAGEIQGAQLLIAAAPDVAGIVTERAAALGVGTRVVAITPAERERAFASADVVIAAPGNREGPSTTAIMAFSYGRPLLAADVAGNREVTPNGRGCLWFRPESARDLAFRAAFLARNPDLRSALGSAGRAHLEATRGVRAVAEAYDEVYRHALARHSRGSHLGMFEAPALQVG